MTGQVIDITTTGSSGTHNGAIFEQGDGGGSAGTGLFDPFYQVQTANAENVSGVNTAGRPTQFQTVANGAGGATELLLSTVTQIDIGGVRYREFFLDINQTAGNAIYDMVDVQVYTDNEPDLNCLDPGAQAWGACDDDTEEDLIFWLDGAPDGNTLVRMNYSLEAGSGKRDLRMLIPDVAFGAGPECDYGQTGCGLYVYVYSAFTPNDDGFEEWSTSIQPFIQIQKTAAGSLQEDTDWTIEKTVNIDSWSLFTGDTGTSKYTIALDKTVTQSNIVVAGTISLTVPDQLPDGDENAIAAEVTDLTDVFEGISATTLTCDAGAPPFTVDPGETVLCTYEIDLDSEITGTNTATATILNREGLPQDYVDTAQVGSYTVNAFGEPGTVNVSDTNGQSFGPFSDDDMVMYEVTFGCDDEGTNPNTASINETGDSDDADVTVTCYTPTVAKTVETSTTINYTWTVDKSVTPASWDLFTGDSGTSDYTVDVTRSSTASGFMVDGSITITNPHPTRALDLTAVTDAITPGDIAGTVDCGGATSVASSGGELVCSYSATLTEEQAEAATTNTATATYQNYAFDSSGGSTAGGTSDIDDDEAVDFSNVTNVTEVDKTATATDDWATPSDSGDDTSWQFGGSGQATYSIAFTCDEDEGERVNTVQIVGDDTQTVYDTDDATVTVTCHQLTVEKDAETSFTREWDWDVAKTGFTFGTTEPVTSIEIMLGQTYQVEYDVIASVTGVTDSDWAVAGQIDVSNPAPIDAVINGVSDLIAAGAIDGEPACGVAFPYTLDAGGTLNCTYAADLPDGADRTNTATATLQNYTYASDGSPTPSGTTDYSGNADVDFADAVATITKVDECATLADPNAPAGTFDDPICASEAPKTVSYTYGILYEGAEFCGPQQVMNTATITEADTGENDDASWTVDVLIECLEGCTLTQGYWKTHNESFWGGAPPDATWQLIQPDAEKSMFFGSGQTYFDVMWTAPKGNAYYNLAHQYIAAVLNTLNGAAVPTEVANALTAATGLFDTYTPAQIDGLRGRAKRDWVNLAGTLASYNEGEIGPGHCDEDACSDGVTESAAGARVAASSGSETSSAVAASEEEAAVAESDTEAVDATDEDAAGAAPAAEARVAEAVPEAFAVSANYPNPFDRTTTIRVDLPEAAPVRLTVLDPLGRVLAVLADASLDAGVHRFTWDAGTLPSGTYFYVVQSGENRSVHSMVLVR